MALIDSTRIRLHPTPAERVALVTASWISKRVADRMDARARRVSEAHATHAAVADESRRRDAERARSYLLGIR